MHRNFFTRRGFTLIELMVVVGIIMVVSAIGLVSYTQASVNSRNAKRKADLEQIRAALVLYRTDIGAYPGPTVNVQGHQVQLNGVPTQTLQTAGYLNSTVSDPSGINGTPYAYTTDNPRSSPPASKTFNLCATLEATAAQPTTQYCITNP